MLSILKKLFHTKPEADYGQLIRNGAQLVDVRTPREFEEGHIAGAINIPHDKMPYRMDELQKDKPVILYCGSGSRSSYTRKILASNGFREVYNGGGYRELLKIIN
jgi:rhodanese-related sulfurtransferase